ncbi:MAG TPA: hypothetical protein P5265_06095 [Bacteroidia bacterium]|nr:hypothetical protein [Sphingobacteriales bacterium]HPD64339.1 hypothetical protein [Bacteroidia bacterium]HRU68053.1 hypothetical protein [Bacteroidia bacterium]
MKKIFFMLLVIFLTSLQSKAYDRSLFDYDEIQIRKELSELNSLESYVSANEGVTLSQLKTENNRLTANISNSPMIFTGFNGVAADIPAFLWGFCLGPIGVIIVWIIDEDDLLMSIVGCLVSSFLFGGGYLLVN